MVDHNLELSSVVAATTRPARPLPAQLGRTPPGYIRKGTGRQPLSSSGSMAYRNQPAEVAKSWLLAPALRRTSTLS